MATRPARHRQPQGRIQTPTSGTTYTGHAGYWTADGAPIPPAPPAGWGNTYSTKFVLHRNLWRCTAGVVGQFRGQTIDTGACTMPEEPVPGQGLTFKAVNVGDIEPSECPTDGGCGHSSPHEDAEGTWAWVGHQETRDYYRHGCDADRDGTVDSWSAGPPGAPATSPWTDTNCGRWVTVTTTTEAADTTTTTRPADTTTTTRPADTTTTTLAELPPPTTQPPPTTTTTIPRGCLEWSRPAAGTGVTGVADYVVMTVGEQRTVHMRANDRVGVRESCYRWGTGHDWTRSRWTCRNAIYHEHGWHVRLSDNEGGLTRHWPLAGEDCRDYEVALFVAAPGPSPAAATIAPMGDTAGELVSARHPPGVAAALGCVGASCGCRRSGSSTFRDSRGPP